MDFFFAALWTDLSTKADFPFVFTPFLEWFYLYLSPICNCFFFSNFLSYYYSKIAGVCCGPCNSSKWEADIWGWLEVRRSAILHCTVNQLPHWACRQYGHTGGTRGWLGVKRWQLCLQDTSRSAKCHQRAAISHCFIVCVQCCRMVDSVPIWHTISILYKASSKNELSWPHNGPLYGVDALIL